MIVRLCIVLLLFSSLAHGEIMTYEQALSRAAAQNLDIQVAYAKQQQAQALAYKMLSPYLPRLTATGTYTHNSHEAKFTLPSSVGGGREIIMQPAHLISGQVQLSQMLISPWMLFQASSAKTYVKTTKLAYEQAKREILYGVAQLYYAVASSKEAITLQKRLLEGRKAHEKVAQLRFHEGYVIKAEVLRAGIDTAKNEQDLTLAENTYAAQKLALATMLNRDTNFDIASPPPPKRPTDEQVNAVNLGQNRLDLRAARLQNELAGRNNRLAFLRYLPELGMFLNYKVSDNAGLLGAKDNYAVGLNLTWNIFDGGMREAEVFENSAKAHEAYANARKKELVVNQEIEQAKLDLKGADAVFVNAQKQVELARENFRIVDASKAAGAVTYLEFSDASDNLANAEMGLIAQNFNVSLAALKLQHALGNVEK